MLDYSIIKIDGGWGLAGADRRGERLLSNVEALACRIKWEGVELTPT